MKVSGHDIELMTKVSDQLSKKAETGSLEYRAAMAIKVLIGRIEELEKEKSQ